MHVFRRLPRRALPGLVVAGVLICYSSIILLPVPRISNVGLLYLTGVKGFASDFFSPLLVLLFGVCIIYTVVTEHDLSRYTLTVVVCLLLFSELRYGADSFAQLVSALVGLLLTSVLLAEVTEPDTDSAEGLFEFPPTGLFQLAALTTYGLLAVGLAAVVVSTTLFDTSPLLLGHGSTAAVERVIGDETVYRETHTQFYAVVVAVTFLAVVTDATRHTEVRWLTTLTAVVDFAAAGLLIAPTRWNATVAAVGALCTVTVLAICLHRRHHTPLPTRSSDPTFK